MADIIEESEKEMDEITINSGLLSTQKFDHFENRTSDIINLRNIILFIQTDTRLNERVRSRWYQFWLPETISYLNEYYGYPENVIETRLEFNQKLYERVVITIIIGFTFIIIRTFPILSNSDRFIREFYVVIGVLLFVVICLVVISYYLMRYPTLKHELMIWIKEEGYSMYLSSNDPKNLLNETEVEDQLLDELQYKKK